MPHGKLLFSQISAYLAHFQHCCSLVLLLVIFEWKIGFAFCPQNSLLVLEGSNLAPIPRSLSQVVVFAEVGVKAMGAGHQWECSHSCCLNQDQLVSSP